MAKSCWLFPFHDLPNPSKMSPLVQASVCADFSCKNILSGLPAASMHPPRAFFHRSFQMQTWPVLSPAYMIWWLPVFPYWKSLCQVWLFVTPGTIQSLEFSRPEYWSGWPFPSPGDLPSPGIKARSPALQADSLPAEPPGKPKTIGVGSLSLLQRIFPTQESTQGLLHFREILYQLRWRPKSTT